jgi:hypothetical protein
MSTMIGTTSTNETTPYFSDAIELKQRLLRGRLGSIFNTISSGSFLDIMVESKPVSVHPQEVAQSVGITLNEAVVTSLNPPSPFLCGYVKKKKKNC